MNLVNRDKLLSDIAEGMKALESSCPNTSIMCLEVTFLRGRKKLVSGSLVWALDCLANDIYWNEDGSWDNADSAHVRVI